MSKEKAGKPLNLKERAGIAVAALILGGVGFFYGKSVLVKDEKRDKETVVFSVESIDSTKTQIALLQVESIPAATVVMSPRVSTYSYTTSMNVQTVAGCFKAAASVAREHGYSFKGVRGTCHGVDGDMITSFTIRNDQLRYKKIQTPQALVPGVSNT